MTSQAQRLNALLELVADRGSVSNAEIAEELGISEATTRRYLQLLADQRMLTRTRGGATALGSGFEWPLQFRADRQTDQKLRIAEAALECVSIGDSVGLNGGTTTIEIARALGRSTRLGADASEPGVTVVTNALNIGYELSVRSGVRVVVTGGVARRQSFELIGSLVDSALASLTLDLAILGIDGIDPRFGVTTVHDFEAHVSTRMRRAAKRVMVVADSTKLGRVAFARVCALDEIDILVTDAPPTGDIAAALTEAQVEVVVADGRAVDRA